MNLISEFDTIKLKRALYIGYVWPEPKTTAAGHRMMQLLKAFKDKGFEILGVSLDRDKTRWAQAIEKDQLPWLHVSDLRQWKSVAAKTYGVSSIPFTVLLDEEGKIIAMGLRG